MYLNIRKATGLSRDQVESLFPHGLASVYTWVGIPIHSISAGCKPIPDLHIDDYRDVYMDYNATTPVRHEVATALSEFYGDPMNFGNPSSNTNMGKIAHNFLSTARRQVADCMNVKPSEIVFTGGGTEANNMAVKGIAFKYLEEKGHIIATNYEHKSVLEPLQYLEKLGFEVEYLPVNESGRIEPGQVKNAIRKDTILVCVMAANNEIGSINPLSDIGHICREHDIPLMCDAIQAFGKVELDPRALGISLLSISAHKIYGPKGVGALYMDPDVSLSPLIEGGGQERGRRGGTENVAGIMALGKAAQLICREMEQETARLRELRDYFLTELRKIEPDLIVNGSMEHRVAHNLNVGFPGIDGNALLLSLNQIGAYVSTGSACNANSIQESYVIKALGVNTEEFSTIRFSFGLHTKREDLKYVLHYLPWILEVIEAGGADTY